MTAETHIRAKDRDAILQSLRAGVVPRIGQQHLQVGRLAEVQALLKDIERIAEGGSAVRFVIGEYGSGKTFFLHLVRSVAQEKRLVTAHADLSPVRRLHATNGHARALYSELMGNLATRTKPEGGALPGIVERFVSTALAESKTRGIAAETAIQERLAALSEMVGGYDFGTVIAAYWRGHDTGNETLKTNAVRWLRGEYTSRVDARTALGVRTIVDDANLYDHLKLMAHFVRLAGYAGLLIGLDELVNLYKLANPQARNANYEQILHILNDCLQGTAVGCGFLFCGTPEFLSDTRRGLYSYPALASRLAENTFAVNSLVDYTSPVLRLANLSAEDFFVLLHNVRHVYAAGNPAAYLLPDQGLKSFMAHCHTRVGEAYFRTPRTTITSFINLLAVLEQNPNVVWHELITRTEIAQDPNPDSIALPEQKTQGSMQPMHSAPKRPPEDELATFRL